MRLIYVLLIASVLGVTPAFAEPPKPKIVPECHLVTTKNGQEMCAYTLDEWKKVLAADTELSSKRRLLDLERQKSQLMSERTIEFQVQVEACSSNQSLLISHTNKLTQDLIDLDKKYQYERVKPRLGSPWAWAVSAVSVSVLAGFVLHSSLN